ncbi:MAG: hypothetical protein JSV44_12585 [Candidatus Zixiibacteriota bacterium]|nr:MAG: hypothetical protein JSV44_12585 [candidate division Zixibacteria bacterium]
MITSTEAAEMKVKFTLTMDDATVNGRMIDTIVLDWISELDYSEVLNISHDWISSQNFLTQRMTGLSHVGESSLTIEPLEDF